MKYFNDISELRHKVLEINSEEGMATVVANFYIIELLFKELVSKNDVDIACVTLVEPEYDGYDDDYVLTLSEEEVYVDKTYEDDAYIELCGGKCLIHENSSARFMQANADSEFIMFNFGEEEEESTPEISVAKCKNGNIASYSYVSPDNTVEIHKYVWSSNRDVIDATMDMWKNR